MRGMEMRSVELHAPARHGSGWVAVFALLMVTTSAWGQPVGRDPRIGYVYPAGAQRGERVQVLIGGQGLRAARDVLVSGDGVEARVVQHFRPLMNLDGDQRKALQMRMRELVLRRLDELPAAVRNRIPLDREFPRGVGRKPAADENAPKVEIPEHPILLNLEDKNLRELLYVRDELVAYRMKQPNPQIAETLLVEISVNAKAAPGDREIRIATGQGLTNPLRFQVGTLPETREMESNDPGTHPFLPPEPPVKPPAVVNGQIKPGDVDRIAFTAKRGQNLVITTSARELVPYLADAVPGWFQATVAIYDEAGEQIAFADDYRFDPDPVLHVKIPSDGVYELEIRDSIYRGREDFVYRVCIAEQPFITDMFPLGGRTGTRTVAAIDGWNLGSGQLPLATPPGMAGVHQVAWKRRDETSNPVVYAVDTLPESTEREPNNTPDASEQIELPRVLNGRIDAPGDVDLFAFAGRKGRTIVAEVHARRLQSPLDSVLHLTGPDGDVVAWNDDRDDPESGLLTHHADSYLRAELPADGTYRLRVADAQQHGGPAYGYRLRISEPRPDYVLRMTPSSVNMRAGWPAPICVYAVRKDGFDGPIDVTFKGDATGFALDGARIPAGRDRVWMTLAAPPQLKGDGPVALQLEGTAKIAGRSVRRPVVPADDMMQAFAYRHLVPAQELLVAVAGAGRRGIPRVELRTTAPVRVPAGASTEVLLEGASAARAGDVKIELREPPAGITLETVRSVPGKGLAVTLKADGEAAKPGLADNLIFEIFSPAGAVPARDGKPAAVRQRASLGILPAIPFEVTGATDRR